LNGPAQTPYGGLLSGDAVFTFDLNAPDCFGSDYPGNAASPDVYFAIWVPPNTAGLHVDTCHSATLFDTGLSVFSELKGNPNGVAITPNYLNSIGLSPDPAGGISFLYYNDDCPDLTGFYNPDLSGTYNSGLNYYYTTWA
jgi:hypothetical protein